MSSVVISGDTSGSITVSVPAVSGSNIVTIPAVTGTVMVSSNMPAFSAYQSSAQAAFAGSTFVKVQFQTEEYDTNGYYDNSTNYRFTPLIAGYYQINASMSIAISLRASILSIFKNGSEYKRGGVSLTDSGGINSGASVSSVVYLNGSTDYVEIYGYQNSGSSVAPNTGIGNTWFNGCMIRTA